MSKGKKIIDTMHSKSIVILDFQGEVGGIG